jgi:23S rRNA (cytosine1962-C5)-methyltransferase
VTSLVVPSSTVSFIAGGGRDVDYQAPIAPGEHVTLTDDAQNEVALAIADPDNQRLRVFATPKDGFTKIDGALLAWRVERALRLRTQLGLVGPDRAYHLLHGAGDGVPGFACDVLASTAVLYAYSSALLPLATQLADAVVGFAKLDGCVIKVRTKGTADDVPHQSVVGKSPPETLLATEHDVPYEIHPHAGLNHGLFTDMREQRRALARFVAPSSRVLNLFSYTGSLGLACARAGAATVTNVDTSQGVQSWARSNFGRSNLVDAGRYKFEVGDAARFLVRAAKDNERYDVVLVDPPSTSSAAGKSWALGRDYPDLIAKAAAVIPTDGLLWLAANTHDLGPLAKLAHKGLRQAGRTASVLESAGLPPEYPTVAAQASDRYLQIVVLRLT